MTFSINKGHLSGTETGCHACQTCRRSVPLALCELLIVEVLGRTKEHEG
jgi:hypothetical protein